MEEAGPGNQKCCEFTKNCKLGLSRSCRAHVPKCLRYPIFFLGLFSSFDIFSGHLYFLAHNKGIAWIIPRRFRFSAFLLLYKTQSEMEVAPRFKSLTLFTWFTLLTLLPPPKAGLGVWMERMYWIPYKCVKCDNTAVRRHCTDWYEI